MFCTTCHFNQCKNNVLSPCFNSNLNTIKFDRNEFIFSEEERLNGIYCIREGACSVSKMGSNGKDQIIELLSKGTLLGIRSVINTEKTNLKAIAITPLKTCFIPKNVFFDAIRKDTDFAVYLLQILSNYIKRTDDKIIDLGQKSLKQRAAKLLLSLPEYFEKDESGFLDVRLRREDMANIIGVATESFIRTLSFFHEKHWIALRRKQIRLIDIQKLQQLNDGFHPH